MTEDGKRDAAARLHYLAEETKDEWAAGEARALLAEVELLTRDNADLRCEHGEMHRVMVAAFARRQEAAQRAEAAEAEVGRLSGLVAAHEQAERIAEAGLHSWSVLNTRTNPRDSQKMGRAALDRFRAALAALREDGEAG